MTKRGISWSKKQAATRQRIVERTIVTHVIVEQDQNEAEENEGDENKQESTLIEISPLIETLIENPSMEGEQLQPSGDNEELMINTRWISFKVTEVKTEIWWWNL